jgi:hypothetical protein
MRVSYFSDYSGTAILWLSYMKSDTVSSSIAEAKIPGACAEMDATHAENDSSSSHMF